MKTQLEQSVREKLNNEQTNELDLFIEASEKYYMGNTPIMTDAEFDLLSDKLTAYNITELTEFINKSIYRKDEGMVPVDPDNIELQEMISLFKIKYKSKASVVDINKFFRQSVTDKNLLKFYSPKFDGAAIKITFDLSNDESEILLIQSRGGLDITELLKNHPDIIATKKYRRPIIAGELVINKTTFLNKYSIDSDTDYEYENARNFVGSLIKQNSIEKEIFDDIEFVACTDGKNPIENTILLDKAGEVLKSYVWKPLSMETLYNLEGLIKLYKSDVFPYLCDGIVLSYHEEGPRKVKDNYPLNMVSVKFPAPRAKTIVEWLEWTQKKSGKLTPKLLIKPVKLDGSTITKVNGYNYQNIIDKHIGIGSIVEIEKSGDIIPIVVSVLKRSTNIIMPECEYIRKGKHLIAADLQESIKYRFILGIKVLGIDGIGETISEQLGSVVDYDIIELFNPVRKPDILNLLGNGSTWSKFQEIYNIRSLYLDTLIQLMQFNQVGPKVSKKVALLITKQSNDTKNIPGEVLTNICKGEGFAQIKININRLLSYGVKVTAPIEINDDSLTFEMTGTPPGMSKQEFVKKIKDIYPNSLHESIKKTTKYLICDDVKSNTSKCNKARKYNIKMITYSDALQNKF